MVVVGSGIAVAVAFIIGAFPTAHLVARRLRRIDLLQQGSGNSGALNTFRQVGTGAGLLVLIVDLAKGAAAILIGMRLGVPQVVIYISAAAVVTGHNYSPFLGFRGGKGAATGLGASATLLWTITLPAAGAGILMFAVTRHAAAAIATVMLVLIILVVATLQPAGVIGVYVGVSGIIVGTHIVRRHDDLIPALRERRWRRAMTIE